MKLLIAIPSKNRAEILEANAWKWVSKMNLDFKVFIEPQDYAKYKHLPNLVSIEANDQGLGYAKQFIKDYAIKNGYTHVFKMDDDVRGFTNYRRKLSDTEMPDFIARMLNECESAFEKAPHVKAIVFPYRFEMYEKVKWEVTKRVQTAYIVEVNSMHVDPLISVFEDFAVGLHILVNGGLILKYGLAGIDMGVKVGGGTGGHQSFDRFKQAIKELEELRKIYPPLNYKKVDKPWKIEPDLRSVDLPKKR